MRYYFDNVTFPRSPICFDFKAEVKSKQRQILSWFLELNVRITNLESWATGVSISNLTLSSYTASQKELVHDLTLLDYPVA